MNTDQNKTHGVLTYAEICAMWRKTPPQRDAISIAVWFARAIEAAVLAKAAPQSPVAPADDDAAELIVRDVCELDPANPDLNDTVCVDVSDLLIIAKRHTADRARLADAPTVNEQPPITGHKLNTSAGGRGYVAEYFSTRIGRHDFGRYIAERLAADFACALAVHLDSLPTAPTPPTSADDALNAARYRYLRNEAWGCGKNGRQDVHVCKIGEGVLLSSITELAEDALDQVVDAAIAASKESGDE